MWRAYSRALRSHPLRTNALSAGCIGAAGDGLAQRIERSQDPSQAWDRRRVALFAVFGFTWNGAPAAIWFRWLSNRFPAMVEGRLHAPNLMRTLVIHLTI